MSEAFKLDNSANNFERAQIDVFELDAKIGQIQAIQIGHDVSSNEPTPYMPPQAATD